MTAAHSPTRISLGCGCQYVTASYGERPTVGQTFECRPHGWVHITATEVECPGCSHGAHSDGRCCRCEWPEHA